MASSTASNRREQLRRQQEAQARQKRFNRIVGIVAGAVALVLVGVFGWVFVQTMRTNAPSGDGSSAAALVPPNVNADSSALVVNTTPAPEGAPVVTVYLDYQCPNCKVFEEDYGAMLEEEANAGTWTLQNSTLTFMNNNLQNTASIRSAYAAACSAFSGPATYSAYGKAVYANQAVQEIRGSEGYSDELLRETIPAQVGITGDALTQFQSCYDNQSTKGFVETVEKAAYADQVTGTPTIAINGKIIDRSKAADGSPEALKALLLANA